LKKHVVDDYFTEYQTKDELKKLPGVNKNPKRDFVEDEEDVIRE